MEIEKPYVSFIVTVRNDDYGHKFLYRTQRFSDNLVYLCEKYKLPSEIIFVEWNPPKEKERFEKALKVEKNRKFTKIRIISVSKKIHDEVKTSERLPLLEFPGKNAGIRRAKGEFLIVTNPDIIFSKKMIKFISKRKLRENIFYRADRCDMFVDIPMEIRTKDVEKFCEKKWNFCWSPRYGRYHRGIKFITDIPRLFARTIIKMTKDKAYLRYHGGAPGDFILMDKKSWENFRGYPEMNVHGGMDGYVSILAIASGNKLKIMKEKTYHQSHGNPASGERPLPDMSAYIADAKKMLKEKKPMTYNDENWGLKKYNLEDKEF